MNRSALTNTKHQHSMLILSLAIVMSFVLIIFAHPVHAADDYQFALKWGTGGIGDGQFMMPYDITMDSNSNIYIADNGNNRVQKFDISGKFLDKWGAGGSGDGQLNQPFGIAVDKNNNVYVADAHNHRIQKFSSNGAFIAKWGSYGSGDGQLKFPASIAIDSNDNVYVVDWGNSRIQKFDINGKFLEKWGTEGTGTGQFSYPHGITVDKDGNIYVADTSNNRIQKFSSDGEFLLKWGVTGSGEGQFIHPYGMAVDFTGSIYVVDGENDRIQKFSMDGTFITEVRSTAMGDGQLKSPNGVVIDFDGNMYIVDMEQNCINKFIKSDAELVSADKTWLTFDKIKSNNTTETAITSDLNLLTSGPNGSKISWSSSNIIVVATDGKVIRPASGNSDASVTITATVTRGASAEAKTFKLNVKAASPDSTLTTPTASSFSDIPDNVWYMSFVDTLVGKGVVSGYSDNTFRPGASVTRAEFSKMISLAMGWEIPSATEESFTDVSLSSWAAPYIEIAKSHGILNGYSDGKFNPTKPITRAEIATILARVKNLESTSAIFADTDDHWANGYIGACNKAGIISGYNSDTYKPDVAANRAEAAKLIASLL